MPGINFGLCVGVRLSLPFPHPPLFLFLPVLQKEVSRWAFLQQFRLAQNVRDSALLLTQPPGHRSPPASEPSSVPEPHPSLALCQVAYPAVWVSTPTGRVEKLASLPCQPCWRGQQAPAQKLLPTLGCRDKAARCSISINITDSLSTWASFAHKVNIYLSTIAVH